MTDALIRIEHVEKVYRRDQIEIPVLMGVNLDMPGGRVRRAHGPVGLGQDDAPEPDRRHRPADPRPDRRSAAATSRRSARPSSRGGARTRSASSSSSTTCCPVLTAFENVELPLLLTNLKKAERRKHVETALSIVGLSDRMDHYPRQLSGGQEQRVAIARAIVSDPKILVADEPTGDLDAKSGEEILELLQRLNEEFGKTIVMVTHDPKAAARAHRMVHLDKGVLHTDELTEAGRGEEAS